MKIVLVILLKNLNNIKDNEKAFVNEVLLSFNNSPFKFVFEYRKLLEKESNIHYWFDLFF